MEEIGNGVWIDPIRVYAAQKDAKAKTAFARMVLMFLYKTEELEGKRLHKLDQDIVHVITGWYLIYIYIYIYIYWGGYMPFTSILASALH